jgi:hypothetical protein
MNTPSDTTTAPAQPSLSGQDGAAAAGSWVDALATLVGSRIALFRHESGALARHWARIAARLVLAALAALMVWLLLLAGGVAALAAATGWAWYWLALAAAALHLLAAWFLLKSARQASPPAFPLTRNEFEKDRAWLTALTKPRK